MFAVFDDVITNEECNILKNRIESWYFLNRSDDPKELWNWHRRALDVTPKTLNPNFHSQFEKDFNLTEKLANLQEEICIRVINCLQSNLNVKLTLESSELQTWIINTNGPSHNHGDNGRQLTDYNSLLYLNNDFNGGEFYTENGLIVKPKPGRLTFFDGRNINHGVADIYDNNRYTMIFWWKNTKFN